MAIQHLRGTYDKFDPTKMVPGQLAFVMSGDPSATDGKAIYGCFEVGKAKRFTVYEDKDLFDNLISNTNSAINDASEAAEEAREAARGNIIDDSLTSLALTWSSSKISGYVEVEALTSDELTSIFAD